MTRKINTIFRDHERLIISVCLAGFFLIPYFMINRIPVTGTAYDASIPLDGMIPLVPLFIFPYLTAYAMAFLPVLVVKDKKIFRRVALAYAATMAIAYATFILYPVNLPHPAIYGNGLASRILSWFYSIDYPFRNNFPSLHVAIVFLSAFSAVGANKKYYWMIVWAAVIAISTLFVKQHLAWDVIGGFLLGSASYVFIVKRWCNKNH